MNELFYNNMPYIINEDINDLPDIETYKLDMDKIKDYFKDKVNPELDVSNQNTQNAMTLSKDSVDIINKLASTQCIIKEAVAYENTPLHGINSVGESLNNLNEKSEKINWEGIAKSFYEKGLIPADKFKDSKQDNSTGNIQNNINIPADINIGEDDERYNTYENDPIYKKGISYMQKDGSITEESFRIIKEIAEIHNNILNLYVNMPFENWNDIEINKFKRLLTEYGEKLDILNNILNSYVWNNTDNEIKFNTLYHDIICFDYESYKRMCDRHEHYIIYRANRIQLLMKLFKIVERPVLPHNKSAKMVFNYLARQCDNFPLYMHSTDGKNEEVLTAEIHKHKTEFMHDILTFNAGGRQSYNINDFYTITTFYVFCRRMLFDIFNMFTSHNKYNGYTKYKNFYDDFCNGNISEKQLEQMYNSIRSKIGITDDYHNTMDQHIYNQQDLFESWWKENVNWYHENQPERFTKDKIVKINMIPTDVNACRVKFGGHSVFTNAKFYTGDIIEICPARTVGKESLYSKDMRDIVFEVIPHEKWVVPFGYCQYYKHADYKNDSNCSYEWDSKTGNIIIRALCNMPENTELVLQIVKFS
ncbi:MAG: hypothetical protein [Wendovervirus sonii]|uniref:Uncharacterized protein n=1 Tax=phage Lak_Megaphage_Sonny TaxID=3109229 RepID=A0ABZ0Z5A6_9CAUD|nr:MAG: hypothetical protein [phage Lak_Megaphage_Sonny]